MNKCRAILERKKGQRDNVNQQIRRTKLEIVALRRTLLNLEKAEAIIKIVSTETQKELGYRISEPVTLALKSIFANEEVSVEVKFPYRRNQTECDIYFQQKEALFNPIRESAGGLVDVASFAFRTSIMFLHFPPPAHILILDEPFKHLDVTKQKLAGNMLKTVSKQLQLQILTVTHSPALIEYADDSFTIEKRNGRSYLRSTH